MHIRQHIDYNDKQRRDEEHAAEVMEAVEQEIEEHNETTDGERSGVGETLDVQHIRLGSKQSPQSISQIMEQHASPAPQASPNDYRSFYPPQDAFKHFHTRLSTHLTGFFHDYNIPLPDARPIKVTPDEQVCLKSHHD